MKGPLSGARRSCRFCFVARAGLGWNRGAKTRFEPSALALRGARRPSVRRPLRARLPARGDSYRREPSNIRGRFNSIALLNVLRRTASHPSGVSIPQYALHLSLYQRFKKRPCRTRRMRRIWRAIMNGEW
jgi:hypothetical protein